MEITEVKEGNAEYDAPVPVREVATAAEQTVTEAIAAPEPPVETRPDYKALYEEEKARTAKAEFTLYKKNKAEKEARDAQVRTQGFSDPDEISRMVEERTTELLEEQRRKDSEDVLEEIFSTTIPDPDERALARLIYDNKLVKTGYSRLALAQDVENARFLANKPRLLKENGELARTAVSKQTQGNTSDGVSAHRPQPKEDLSKKFTKADWDFMSRLKWPDEKIRAAAAAKNT